MLIPKQTRIRDAAYLKAVREMSCVVTGARSTEYMSVVPHHLTLGRFSAGLKAGDNHVLPLRQDLHQELHQRGEFGFWVECMDTMNSRILPEALKALAEQYYREWKDG